MDSSSEGILYVATGERYIREAVFSSQSFKQTMPDVPQAIFVDGKELLSEQDQKLFDHILEVEDPRYNFLDKMRPLKDSPFDRTLYLDTDCYSLSSCYEVFDLLKTFDLAAAYAVHRGGHESEMCPDCFPQLNAGVIAYRRSEKVLDLFRDWIRRYHEMYSCAEGYCSDQPPFQDALYASQLHHSILPGEYNLHVGWPNLVGGKAEVKILHGRGEMLTRAIKELQAHPTTFLPRMVWFSNHQELEQIFGDLVYQ